MEDNIMDFDAEVLEKLIYKHLAPALRARAGRDADGNPIDALDQPDAAPPPEPPAAPAPNRGGAPIGNQNARKHGLCSKRLTPEQQEALPDAMAPYSLVEEIAALRVKLADALGDESTSHDVLLRYMMVLARMIRIDDRVRHGP